MVESGNEVGRTACWTFRTLDAGRWSMASAPNGPITLIPEVESEHG